MNSRRTHDRWTIHREGYPTLALVALLGAALSLLTARLAPRRLPVVLGLALGGWGFFAQFFRHPPRHIPQDDALVLSPADGTIVAVERVYEPEYFQGECLKLSIYMSALNVHLNRVPVSGQVVYTRYHPGQYLVAFHPKASERNERNTVVLADAAGRKVLVRQIAGLLARRIVPYLSAGQAVRAGDELGFIKFGSRCDVFIAAECDALVTLDQRVRGGETPLARWRS
jgi:phosphatidylserine decarboxylase